jgi:quinoprotein glucose dehydrogenase
MIPHGEGIRKKIIDMGILDPGPVGGASRTGPLVTKTLLFLAQSDNGRNVLRAFDKASGETITEIELPLPPSAAPMTFAVSAKQFIAIAVGGGADSRLITLALP